MNRWVGLAALLVAVLALAACQPVQPEGPTSTVPPAPGTGGDVLDGTSWRLSEAQGLNEPVPAEVEATLRFANGAASGSGGCNRFNAAYTVDGDKITFGPVASTMMACEGPGSEVETAFFAALGNTATFVLHDDGRLDLLDASGDNAVANFRAVTPTALTGTTWNLTMWNNGREGVEGVVEGAPVTVTFNEDGTLHGKACNTFNLGYEVGEAGSITISQGMSTMMACTNPERMMEQEGALLLMLPQAATYSIDGSALELRTADGALVASFTAAE